ncbi:MAG: methyltransferase domain-containing protein [Leptolyngbyaceae cyanobacterium]
MDSVSPQQILQTLVSRYGHDHKSLQFATYVSAYQYLRLYDLMRRYVQPGSQVLDWGTGSGHFSYFLAQAGYQPSGFGFSDYPLFCQNLPSVTYHYQQGSPSTPVELPFGDGTFDAVVSVGVLEHVRETGGQEIASLQEIHRILKPGGCFLCYHFPNRYSWIEFLARFTQRFSHPYLFTAADIRALVQEAQFDLLEMGRYALLPRNIWQSSALRDEGFGPAIATAYNQLDRGLGWLLPMICQNYLFVARKRS